MLTSTTIGMTRAFSFPLLSLVLDPLLSLVLDRREIPG